MNGMFNFHASSQAYTQFWNNSFGSTSSTITSRHIWQAFVQESIRTLATKSSCSFELLDNLPIAEVTGKAFDVLGHNGSIHAATHHSCSECSHPYKQSAITNPTAVPMDVDAADVKMVVLDGIVMGPTVSFEYYHNLNYYKHIFYSIVHLIIVQLHWPMHVEVPSVHITKFSLAINAVSEIAQTPKLQTLRLVKFIKPCGRSISRHIAMIISWEYEECFNDLRNSRIGRLKKITLNSLMMKKALKIYKNTFSVLLALIVLKLLLLLVVL